MPCNLVFTSISGSPPFDIYVTDINGYFPPVNIGPIPTGSTFPVTLELPDYITSAPLIEVTMVDSESCETSTVIQPSGGTSGGTISRAILTIEPKSLRENIRNYLLGQGNTQFFGFGYGTPPLIDVEMNRYLKMFVNGSVAGLPAVITQEVPQTTGGFDSFNNPMMEYNFLTTKVSAGTVSEDAWYTWFIPDSLINNGIQTEISFGYQNSPFIINGVLTNPTIWQQSFNYNGVTYFNGFYKTYTTFPSTEFFLNNTSYDIYFRGLTIL